LAPARDHTVPIAPANLTEVYVGAMTAHRRSVAAVVWCGLAAVIAVSVALAPIRTVGWCAFASGGGGAVCSELQESLIGIESTPWVWLISVSAVVALAAIAALARPRVPREVEASAPSSSER
jgi:hypothetical protein